jgi:ribonuclease-3
MLRVEASKMAGSRVPEISRLHMKHADAADLERKIGYTFKKRELLEQALTHSSHASEHGASQGRGNPPPGIPLTAPLTAPGTALAAPIAAQDLAAQDNEQLEFLGDAVLGFVTSHELFQRFPDYTEGELSKLRAQLVSARHLIHTARELQLGEYLRLGRGEEKSGGRGKAALLVDALEAVVAALFLDAGLEVARDFVLLWVLSPELDGRQGGVESLVSQDYKSELQERLHALGRPEPRYLLISEAGPDHQKLFTLEAVIVDPSGQAEFSARGQGLTKKRAGQDAAREALEKLNSRLEAK